MKKALLFIFFISTLWSYSQVKGYTFLQTTGGVYNEIKDTDGTLLGTTANDSQRFVGSLSGGTTTTGVGFDIGFNFVYDDGSTYDRFAVVTDGWIALGSSTLSPAVNTNVTAIDSPMGSGSLITPDVLATKICPLGLNLQGQTGSSLLYKMIGDAPNRVLVVQWKNYRKYAATGDSFSFQVKLYETSNKIEFVYGTMTTNVTWNATCQVGLRAEPSATASNFTNRTSATGWNATAAGKLATDNIVMNNALTPASGLTYTWIPPTCASAKNLVVSAVTANSATLTWDHYNATPLGYEYVVTPSATLPTASGTVTTTGTAALVNLTPATAYNVFIRSSCGTDFSQWTLEGTFRTSCSTDGATAFTENFDSYTSGSTVPNCWAKGGNGTTYINSGSGSPGSAPNALYMVATQTGTASVAYAVMPKVSNLQTETNRLKFKAFTTDVYGTSAVYETLDVGYFTDNTNMNSFVLLQTVNLPSPTASSAIEFVITPKSIPAGVNYLGFRNKGTANGSVTAYIDDVIWEPIPPCPDVKSLVVNQVFSTSANVSWIPGDTETAWQYVYASTNPTLKDPSTLTPVDVASSTPTINGLATTTSYSVWVRSKCDASTYGVWIGPVYLTTTCSSVTEFVQNFDASTSFPSCWQKIGVNGTASPQSTPGAPSGTNTLYMIGSSIVAMQPVSNAGDGTHRLSFKLRGAAVGATVEVGYLTNSNDENSFVPVQSYAASSATAYDNIVTAFGTAPTTPYLAFRVPAVPTSTVYVDDVVWEPIPPCPEVSTLALTSIASNSADLSWTTSGTENAWQYAVGAPETTNPYSLTAKDFTSVPLLYGTYVSGTVDGLTPSTSYKIWLRSKCSSTSLGAWVGPLTFTTTCAPVNEFIQSFDTAQILPSCWNVVGTGGNVSVIPISSPSNPNVLSIYSSGTGSNGIVAMQPVSNADAGTHRLRFKFRGDVNNTVLEVGFLTNVSDPASFNQLKTFTSNSTTVFQDAVADLGFDPASQILAFRSIGAPSAIGYPSGTIYIDDVVWEPTPSCADVSGLTAYSVMSNSIDLSWKAGGAETAWQYVVDSTTAVDPSTLTPVDATTTETIVNGLTPSTSYKIWVRSKCNSAFLGSWIGPLNFTTTCALVTEFSQNFDSSSNTPSCWSKVGTDGTVSVTPSADAPSSPNVMSIFSSSYLKGVLALQPVSNAGAGTHRLRFKFRGSVVGANLEFGYLNNASDPNSFNTFQTFTASSTTTYDLIKVIPPVGINVQVLAFRNSGSPAATVYIDDVVWEAISDCPDITAVAVKGVMSNSAGLSCTTGTATAWQYVIGASTVADPNTLTPVDVSSATATVNGLTPSTNYKVWVRTKCDSSFGVWSDPSSFTTVCAGVNTFSQNFDASTLLPDCWKRVGGNVAVYAQSGFDAPNALILNSTATLNATVAMPYVTNASAGTQRLKFKFRSSVLNGVLEVGYVTDVNDQSTFVPLQSYVSSSTSVYDSKIAVLGTKPIAGSILAFRNPANPVCYITIDDVSWEFNPSCTDVANVVVKLPTSNSVQLSWDSTGTETAWQYAYASSTVTDPSTLPSASIFDVNSNNITVNSLMPNTSYVIWVRSNCGSGIYGLWAPSAVFVTPCPSVDVITQNFDAGLTLPDCWHIVGASGSVAVATAKGTASTNALELTSPAANTAVFATIPSLSTAVAGGYEMKFKYKSGYSLSEIDIICYMDLVSGSYKVLKTITVATPNTQYVFDEVLPSAETPYLGLRVSHPGASTTVDIDDFGFGLPLATACANGITVSPDPNCGNLATAISWMAAPYATAYTLSIGTTSGAKDVLDNQELANVLTYSFKGKANTKYYYTVTPHNALGSATGCKEQSFTTAPTICYCTSAPISYDGAGITNVQIGATNFAYSKWNDYAATPVNLVQGVNSNLNIAFDTGSYGYWTNIWIDFNDNYEFEDSEMVVNLGKASTTNPSVFDASFMMPATAQLGIHQMRIVATSEQQVPANPCYSGTFGVTMDFKLNIVSPVLNDEPEGAIILIPGGSFAANAITGTNVNATGSILEPAPGCGNYNGVDVWYKAAVPASGNITFEVNSVAGGLINTAGAVYNGAIGAFTLVKCDDSSSTAGGDQPKIALTGRTAGEILYFRVWENGGDAFGTYMVSAYDATLGVDTFDISNFSFHPNPVKNVLNISLDQDLTNIAVYNLLGQLVINQSNNSNQVKIDMSGLTVGTYLIKASAGDKSKTIKVVKE